MADSLTGEAGDTSSSNDDVLDTQTTTADEQQDNSVSSDVSQSTEETQHDESHSTESSEDDGLSNFAKSQGFDPDNLTENEKRALKIAHDNQKAFRSKKQQESDKLKETVADTNTVSQDELDDMDPRDAAIAQTQSDLAKLRAEQKVNSFYMRNPEAQKFDKEMTEIVLEEAERNGNDAARYLAADLDRLLILAKARRGDSSEAARQEGARQERENLRRKQEGSADGGHAQNTHQSTPKVTRDWVNNEYDPSNADHRKMLDAALASGDLY